MVQGDVAVTRLKVKCCTGRQSRQESPGSLVSAKVPNPSVSGTQPLHPPHTLKKGAGVCGIFCGLCQSSAHAAGNTKVFLQVLMNSDSSGVE